MRAMVTDRRLFLAGGLAVASLPLLGRPARAQLQLDINRGYVEPMPIAIPAFSGAGPADTERGRALARVVQDDLDASGLFKTIDARAYIQSPEELANGVPRFADWRQINAQALIVGQVRGAGSGALTVEFRSWDVFAGQELAGVRFSTTDAAWRRIAHKVADTVYERLTGQQGYFDTRIVYVAESGPLTRRTKRVAVMDQDGANQRYLTDGSNLVLTPRVAPDARRVAFMAYRGGPPKVVVKDMDTGREGLLGNFAGMTFAPRFSPDGRSLLISAAQNGNSDIYLADVGSLRTTRLTDGAAIDTSPSFSPDGSQIVFNSDRGGTPQLYVMSASGGGARRVSFGEGRYGSPAWSPKGDLIAFTNIKGGLFSIGIMQPDGGNERLITRSFQDQGPSWAPNGRVLIFAREDPRADRARLFTIAVSGYNEREITTSTDASDPDWSGSIPG